MESTLIQQSKHKPLLGVGGTTELFDGQQWAVSIYEHLSLEEVG